jgi:acetylornithine deacetylase/succinyl-diaminopimelate desuccinylase-like protein
VLRSRAFKAASAVLARDHDRLVADIIAITQIPAPPFNETARGRDYAARLTAAGLRDVETDAIGNVMGLRRGTGPAGRPLLVVAAHLDTVFPEGTVVTVRRQGTRLSAPGVGDDSRGLAVLLAWVRAMDAARVRTSSDILFVGTVGEEGSGDLRGVRHLLSQGRYQGRIARFIAVDGSDAAQIVTRGVGSRRYRTVFRGPGGHSFGAFGIVTPMAAMARVVSGLYAVRPASPETTYSASVVSGGTSINAIPSEVALEVDLRSADPVALTALDNAYITLVEEAVAAENGARSTAFGQLTAERLLVGDRPAGRTGETEPLARVMASAARAFGYSPRFAAVSTDANIPMSLGIPAVAIGSGGVGGRVHAPDEWIDVAPEESLRGMRVGLAGVIAAARLR